LILGGKTLQFRLPCQPSGRRGVRERTSSRDWSFQTCNLTERKNMRKLISLLVAAVFAVSSGAALAASHVGAKPMDKKDEMKKDGKKAAKKEAKKAADKK
jgi:hypothetical protein